MKWRNVMAVTIVGSVYNIPEPDLFLFLNEKTGSTWDGHAVISAVTPVVVDDVIVAFQVTVSAG
jgi:hypothetical protein